MGSRATVAAETQPRQSIPARSKQPEPVRPIRTAGRRDLLRVMLRTRSTRAKQNSRMHRVPRLAPLHPRLPEHAVRHGPGRLGTARPAPDHIVFDLWESEFQAAKLPALGP